MNRATPLRPCGKRYATLAQAEAAASLKPGAEARKCLNRECGGFHVRSAPAPARVPAARPRRRTGPDAQTRKLVLERDGYACVCCGTPVAGRRYSLAHRKRASQGGKAVPENLIVLLGLGAEQHHGRVDLYKDPADAAKGYRLKSAQDPASVPVEYAGQGWFWLLPDGSRRPVEAGEVTAA